MKKKYKKYISNIRKWGKDGRYLYYRYLSEDGLTRARMGMGCKVHDNEIKKMHKYVICWRVKNIKNI